MLGRNLDKLVQDKLKEKSGELRKVAQEDAKKELSLELGDLKQQLNEKDKKLQEAQKDQLEIIKQRRELEEKERTLELQIARKVEGEKTIIKEEAEKRVQEEYRLKDAEKEKKLQDAIRVNEELKRKLEQGSQQSQGEVQELDIEALLRTSFIHDQIVPVPKGVRGADAVQKVYNQYGSNSGSILWESKRTKSWSDGWIDKAKEDQREIQAELVVIVSDILPKEITNFGLVNGVWITRNSCVLGIATALRSQLLQLQVVKASAIGKNEKMEQLYSYLIGPAFTQKVQALLETFMGMQKELETEKRVFTKRWAKRQKQIETVLTNTSGLYGDMQGVIGNTLPPINLLELPEVIEEEEEDKPEENL